MIKQNFDIYNLRVASPCSVGWEDMSGDERTRFCNLCDLNVYNISEMTNEEVRMLVANSNGRICGRIYKRADGTVITQDCPVGLRAYRKRVSHFAATTFAAIIGLCSVVFGQTDSKKDKKSKDNFEVKILRTTTQNQQVALNGTITDPQGAVIPGATVTLINEETKQNSVTTTDENGYFKFSTVTAGTYSIKVESQGFAIYQNTNIAVNKGETLQFEISLKSGETMITVGILIGDEPMLDTTSSGATTVINVDRIEKLPH